MPGDRLQTSPSVAVQPTPPEPARIAQAASADPNRPGKVARALPTPLKPGLPAPADGPDALAARPIRP